MTSVPQPPSGSVTDPGGAAEGAGPIFVESGGLSARIDPLGAQLKSLRIGGQELLWQGAPGFWDQTALVLFPIIAGIAGGVVRVNGRTYPMPAHGFAFSSSFKVETQAPDRLVLSMRDNAETRRHYPFEFALTATFSIGDSRLDLDLRVENRGDQPMPCDVGFHPGFRWPLEGGRDKAEHVVLFEHPEPAPIRRGTEDPIVLLPEPQPSPVEGRLLRPTDAMFEAQAMVFDRFESRSVIFGVPGGQGVRLDFPDSPHFAVWMQPGAAFLCLEPWQGYPGPVGYDGALKDKPGIATVAPGETRAWRYGITPLDETPASHQPEQEPA